ncbi:hypothetical protein [Cryptosporangium arvum]|uniref:Uncharacterized protein n=1 Tax=Cryptosporangium arvum DSM 44712 TaxID=927661 RepID=A0A010ZL10_9ACTN|nr:hypothetical protein [Cryptosporangium arvum]EXG79319.1 hypothetical protein CryarDRAFT_0352 [Cryptosporangium arvum DSM 44712]
MITLQPPPERDLPPGRHDTMRTEILRGIASERHRPSRGPRAFDVRRHFLPILAAAGVLAVICVSVGVIAVTRPDEKPEPAASLPPTSAPPRVVTPVPGFTDAQRSALRDSCVAATKTEKRDLPGRGDLPLARDHVRLDDMRLLNATSRRHSTVALLGNGSELVACSWGSKNYRPSMPPTGGFDYANFTEHAQWMPGVVARDHASSLDSGKEQYLQLMGRVNSEATKIQVVANPDTDKEASVTVDVVNRTYAVTLDYETYNEAAPHVRIRAIDANGKVVGEPGRDSDPRCYVDPNGTVVYGYGLKPPCAPAIPWR